MQYSVYCLYYVSRSTSQRAKLLLYVWVSILVDVCISTGILKPIVLNQIGVSKYIVIRITV